MYRRIWPLHHKMSPQEPSMFHGLRLRLTLWYCGVLSVALVLFSVAIYVGARTFFLASIQGDADLHAHVRMMLWSKGSSERACTPFSPLTLLGSPRFDRGFPNDEIITCFDQNGSLLKNENVASFPPAFLSNLLVKTALQTGQPAIDTIDGGGTVGQIYRYALAVPSPTGHGYIGVVLIGESISMRENTLARLLMLLLTIGGVTLIGAGLGGLFLANRALAPARLAWTNQQRFIADASHELRTPLTLLRADAEVLLRSGEHLRAEDAVLLEDIVVEANHMATLANNMLSLARLDAHSSHREHEVVNLADVARAGARRVRALADQTEISIQVGSHEAAVVIGDPTLLEQAVLALLDNAIKYNRHGGRVTIRTEVKGELALLEVCDTGIGIAAEHLPHLGERFYRVDKARSREAGGTGLGLSIVRSIAVAHGGRLALKSVCGWGTTATLMLPLANGALLDRERVSKG